MIRGYLFSVIFTKQLTLNIICYGHFSLTLKPPKYGRLAAFIRKRAFISVKVYVELCIYWQVTKFQLTKVIIIISFLILYISAMAIQFTPAYLTFKCTQLNQSCFWYQKTQGTFFLFYFSYSLQSCVQMTCKTTLLECSLLLLMGTCFFTKIAIIVGTYNNLRIHTVRMFVQQYRRFPNPVESLPNTMLSLVISD